MPYLTIRDIILFLSRLLLAMIFIIMGGEKLTDFSKTVFYMDSTHIPLPMIAAIMALVVELGAGTLIILGRYTSPLAFILSVYSVATAFLGHHYWTYSIAAQHDMCIHFYKNISMAGGFLALVIAGPGEFSLDGLMESRKKVTV